METLVFLWLLSQTVSLCEKPTNQINCEEVNVWQNFFSSESQIKLTQQDAR